MAQGLVVGGLVEESAIKTSATRLAATVARSSITAEPALG